MEDNISNALLMAAAMLIFIIAVTVTFSLISQTKTTADTVLYSYDDTKYYDEGYENITYTLANEKNLNRKVNMETIMPTVYRYIKEHYGVTIMKDDGTIIARFDETTESIVNNWSSYLKNEAKDHKCEKHYEYIRNLAVAANLKKGFDSKYNNIAALTKLWEKIYGLDKSKGSGNIDIKYGTPWLGDESKIAKRLNVDFGGGTAVYSSGEHEGLNLLENYQKKEFKEIFLFVSDNSGTETDEKTGDSVIIKANTTKLEIIYVMED